MQRSIQLKLDGTGSLSDSDQLIDEQIIPFDLLTELTDLI